MNALFGSRNETNQQNPQATKDPNLARDRAGPEEEDDINRRQTAGTGLGSSTTGTQQTGGLTGSQTGTQQTGGLTGTHHTGGLTGTHHGTGTVQHLKERDVVVEQPAVVNEIVHDKNVHVVQPVVNRQVEVEHVKHHQVERTEHEGKRVIDEGHVAGAPAGYHGGERGLGSRLQRKGSSSSSSSDDEKRRTGTTHRKTGTTAGTTAAGTTGGLTGHHTTGTGLTGHSTTGATGTGLTGHSTTGTTGTGLTGHSTTGTTTTEPHHKTMGEKIKDVFKGHK